MVVCGAVEFAGEDDSLKGGGAGVAVVQDGDVDGVERDGGVTIGGLEGVGGEEEVVGVGGAGFSL